MTDGGENTQVDLTEKGIEITTWHKVTVTQELVKRMDNGFCDYLQEIIQGEFERRIRMSETIKFRNVRGKYVDISPEHALYVARRLYKLARTGDHRTELINRRFIGIQFTWRELRG